MAGYDPPMSTVDGVLTLKSEVEWTDVEEQTSVGNVRALNAIFNGVDLNMFKLINSCTTTKEAWRILEVDMKALQKSNVPHSEEDKRKPFVLPCQMRKLIIAKKITA
ncbi:gag-pol polyprotein [Cucumis melo var. makuwa]|uniref:Gag-pol polyprotein n=1 Tax=Cucumis melo var. makuwa TaxID=1194695 RepID=A0A5A7SLB4_CUCMM|nr:gag-pol polyprotein [Cucumis melo var. makuwa]